MQINYSLIKIKKKRKDCPQLKYFLLLGYIFLPGSTYPEGMSLLVCVPPGPLEGVIEGVISRADGGGGARPLGSG